MKKYIFIFLISLFCFILVGCQTNNQQYKTLKELYVNMNEAFDHYKNVYKEFYEIVSHQYVLIENLTEENKNRLINIYGEDLNSLILLWDSSNESQIIALEFRSVDGAQENLNKLNNGSTIFFISDNMLFLNHYPAYILLDGGYEIEGNNILNKNKDVLLYNNVDEVITIPNGIKKIAGSAFKDNIKIKEINCNEELEEIARFAFYNCTNLSKVKLNDGLKTIGEYTFFNNNSLEYIIIPTGVKYIGKWVFSTGQIFLKVMTLPDTWNPDFITDDAIAYPVTQWKIDANGIPRLIVQ